MENTKVIVPYTSTVLINFCTSGFSEVRLKFRTLGIIFHPEIYNHY
ncbi:hypothetical protein LLT5_06960 [Lactococcus cremoris subsp. cremoris TIFN5]|nr:hypothetical protein LLT5_06960 [Lactococcus cremoris subsp. cremoris TIFN5]